MSNFPLRKRVGFSLIEAAIVLGVVGVVLGGIWSAAAAVSKSHNVNRTFTQMEQAYQGMTLLFNRVTIPANTDFSNLLIKSGYINADFVAGSTIKNPWGGSIVIETKASNLTLQMTVTKVPRAGCTDLITDLMGSLTASVPFARHDMLYVSINGTLTPMGGDIATLLSTIASRCKTTNPATLIFYYQYPAVYNP